MVGITGLLDDYVRPRWQPNDPKQPARTVNWCAIGITSTAPDGNGSIVHFSGTGVDDLTASDQTQRHEILSVTASFYGPNGGSYAGMLRDGLGIGQNREALFTAGIAYVDSQPIAKFPELVNQGWIMRQDIILRFRRIVARNYPVLNIRSSQGSVTPPEGHGVTFDAEP